MADAVAVFDVIAGYDPADPVTTAAQGKRPDSYLTFLDRNGLNGARIGVVRQLFMGPETDPEIRQALEHALADMTRQSAEVVDDVSIPEIDQIPLGKLFCNRFKYRHRRLPGAAPAGTTGKGPRCHTGVAEVPSLDRDPHARRESPAAARGIAQL